MYRWAMGAILGLLVAACGGGNSATAGPGGGSGAASGSGGGGGVVGGAPAGGASGSGGAGGGTAGVVRGAISMHVVPGEGCTRADQWVDFPIVAGGHPVTATETVQTIADGATGPYTNSSGMTFDTTVSKLVCEWVVRDSGRYFQVGFRFGPAGRDGTLSMSASLNVGESRPWGLVLVGQDWGEANYGGQCTYTTLEVDEATHSVRGEVTCPLLDLVTDMPSTQPQEMCTLPSGYYAFENCTPK
jgi:hypothetical protein